MFKITQVLGREILDSRGVPTVEVDCFLEDGSYGRAAVPSGASTGSHEAVELRDGGTRYYGKGVTQAVNNVNTLLAELVCGHEWAQRDLDQAMITLDGTANKSRLGANALLALSLAFAKATAASKKTRLSEHFRSLANSPHDVRLPLPLINLINGGRHAQGAADIQECMVVPVGAKNFHEAVRAGAEVFHALGGLLSERGLATTVGDEGGYAPALSSNRETLDVLMQGIEKAGYQPGKDIAIALDIAATELYHDGVYHFTRDDKTYSSDELIAWYTDLVQQYPIVSIEDGLAEDDWEGHRALTATLGQKVQLVGDDLFVTNSERLQRGITEHADNAILIKLNQIGTLTETIDTITLAESAGFAAIISHRSGETEDTTIADFVVGMGTGQIKTGSLSRSERVAKYNQLLRLEEYLGEVPFAGAAALAKNS